MADMKTYPIAVQGDFLSKQTHASPTNALAELIWNSLDADATRVVVKEDPYGVGEKRIIVSDNGTAFPHADAPLLFGQLGGSWKHLTGETRDKHRFLHGSEGKGRLKALALGRVVDWEVRYREGKEFKSFVVSMLGDSLREVRIGEPVPATEKQTGVRCVVSELLKSYEFLESPATAQEFAEIFATYLKNYKDVEIELPTGKLDVSVAIESSRSISLAPLEKDGVSYPVELEVIEWRTPTERVLYLCNEAGFPLSQAEARLHVPGFNFSAYLKSPFISHLSNEGLLGLAEMNEVLLGSLQEAKEAIKAFHRERTAERAQTVVDQWKDERVYPFLHEPKSIVERLEREVFDIVAVKVNNLLPEFSSSPPKGKKFQLRMLRQAIEKSPEDLQLILTEVLELPEKTQKEFARLLQETSLSAIISASKVVSDRLKFVTGLDALLFKDGEKANLKERKQLHKLLAENTWIFGEEFFLTVDDQSLTEVLRKHLALMGHDAEVDAPVRRSDGKTGIIDLMLTRNVPCHRESELDHLIVELKRPTVTIGAEEITQVEKYAFAVADDERFNGVDARWTFWIISNAMDAYAKRRANQANMQPGLVHVSPDKRISIWAKTWSEVLQTNRHRLRLFQQKLDYNADHDSSLSFLRETYRDILGTKGAADPVEDSSATVIPA